jgi:hypothetical protein
MFGFGKPSVVVRERDTEAPGVRDELNRLENRIKTLELESAERHVAVLNSIEKVMYQLYGREAKRGRPRKPVDEVEETAPDGPGPAWMDPGEPQRRRAPAPEPVSSTHLAKRFKLGG